MKRYKEFINEGLLSAMKPKPMDDILKKLEGLSDSEKIKTIIEYQLDFDLLPVGELVVDGDFKCSQMGIVKLPNNLTVNGLFDCSYNKIVKLPNNLVVNGNLYCGANELTSLPNDLIVDGHVMCGKNKNILEKPSGAKITDDFYNR